MATRRMFLFGAAAAAGFGAVGDARAAGGWPALGDELKRIGRDSGGRLGVAIHDTQSLLRAELNADERFPMCSTFKFLATAAVLKRVDAKKEKLDRRMKFEAKDIVEYSPVTKDRVGGDGMTLAELCEAAMTLSDNTAGNLLLDSIGGPHVLTAFARTIGDPVTRLDRNEPTLNEALPDDPRDTTTPSAMLKNLQAFALGDALSPASREKLTQWLVGNKTGGTRLRAGVPPGWRVGDKTGAGERGTTNDVGILWPPQRGPILAAVYLTGTEAPADKRDGTIAAVGRAIAAAVAA